MDMLLPDAIGPRKCNANRPRNLVAPTACPAVDSRKWNQLYCPPGMCWRSDARRRPVGLEVLLLDAESFPLPYLLAAGFLAFLGCYNFSPEEEMPVTTPSADIDLFEAMYTARSLRH